MSINKYPSNAAVASVAISTGVSGNGTNVDQADTNAADATAFVISTNVNMPVGMYTVSGVNGSAKSKTAISQVASSINNGIYVSTAATQFYAYVPSHWTTRAFAFSTSSVVTQMAYGNGKYVAQVTGGVQDFGRWSTDAITWAATTTVFEGSQVIKYLNNLWLAGGGSNRNLYTSTDGLTWTSRTNPMSSGNMIADFAYGNGIYVGSGGNSAAAATIISSTDGITWVTRAQIVWASSSSTTGIIYGSGGFLAFNGNSTALGRYYVSTDAITWTTRTPGVSTIWQAATYANGIYMLVSSTGYTVTSTDAITWTVKSTGGLPTSIVGRINISSSIAYNNGTFVVTGNDSATKGYAYVTTDGSNWVAKNPGYISGYGVIYGEKWVYYGQVAGTANAVSTHTTSADPSGLTTQGAGIIWERKGNPNGVF